MSQGIQPPAKTCAVFHRLPTLRLSTLEGAAQSRGVQEKNHTESNGKDRHRCQKTGLLLMLFSRKNSDFLGLSIFGKQKPNVVSVRYP